MDEDLGEPIHDRLRGPKDLPPVTAHGLWAAEAARRSLAVQGSTFAALPMIQTRGTVTVTNPTPGIILPAILTVGDDADEGLLVRELAVPWAVIAKEVVEVLPRVRTKVAEGRLKFLEAPPGATPRESPLGS